MNLIYPNKAAINSDKIFIYRINGKEYLFYSVDAPTNGMQSVCFGELKDNAMFAVGADDLDNFKAFLGEFVNGKVEVGNTKYLLLPQREGEVTVYGGSKSQIPVSVLNNLVFPTEEPVIATNQEVVPEVSEVVASDTNNQPAPSEGVVESKPSEPVTAVAPAVKESAPAEVKTENAGEKKTGNKIAMILLVVLLLAIVAVAVYFAYTNFFAPVKPTPTGDNSSKQSEVVPQEEEKPVVINDKVVTCDKTTTEKEREVEVNVLINYDGATDAMNSFIETSKYKATDEKDYAELLNEMASMSYEEDQELGISYVTNTSGVSYDYTVIRSVLKLQVADSTWKEYDDLYGTPKLAQKTLESDGYTCSISE